ncbi:hypothetical protein CFC21_026039 [Triticum aestivum]|uniref:Uncharacterized protein n=3 Tax=Triticum TaxID=4564 RepID=A0A9R1JBT4_WHEAT|nr:hypothetical protein CFC21_026037 [Triticum aestivum]KAF7011767.1 hypothetical protein CFC21_026039 [Triticum aestivum]VAH53293.1 unnamed protein product [Triticum turgidum subsp. durum]
MPVAARWAVEGSMPVAARWVAEDDMLVAAQPAGAVTPSPSPLILISFCDCCSAVARPSLPACRRP